MKKSLNNVDIATLTLLYVEAEKRINNSVPEGETKNLAILDDRSDSEFETSLYFFKNFNKIR